MLFIGVVLMSKDKPNNPMLLQYIYNDVRELKSVIFAPGGILFKQTKIESDFKIIKILLIIALLLAFT